MISLEIINLFPEQYRPQILAYKFYNIQVVREARPVARESVITAVSPHTFFHKGQKDSRFDIPLRKTLPNSIPQHLQTIERRFSDFVVFYFCDCITGSVGACACCRVDEEVLSYSFGHGDDFDEQEV